MRVLWIDADENPWLDANGWKVLESFGVAVRRVSSIEEARAPMHSKQFDALLVRAEMPGALEFLVTARNFIQSEPRKIILGSSTWSKEQFRDHAKGEGAAHRYARVPMPSEGFLGMLADLFTCSVDDLRDFQVADSGAARKVSPPKPRIRDKAASHSDSEDVDVLKKYMRIKEEQLEITENERDELALENERLQKEAQELQARLREFENYQQELQLKIEEMEKEKQGLEKLHAADKESFEREEKVHEERIKALETEIGDANEKYESLRVRVRRDIRKIRANERDLEARLELLRKDSSTLLMARDEKVLEMQRQIDALEFDLDQVQDSRVQAQMESERYLAKLSRVSRALQIALGMIEDDYANEEELDDLEPLMGGAGNAEDKADANAGAGGHGGHGSGAAGGGAAGAGGGPAGAQTPPADESSGMGESVEELSPELSALANDGEPTQMLGREALDSLTNSEPESGSG